MKRASLILLASTLVAGAAAAQTRPDQVRLRSVTYAGTGCPAGSVAVNVPVDARSVTMLWDSFQAEIGPGIPVAAARAQCQIALDLDYPAGWSYAVTSVAWPGFASLDPGITATVTTAYYFAGSIPSARATTRLTGPLHQDFRVADAFPATTTWSPCGAPRSLNLSVAVSLADTARRGGRGLVLLENQEAGKPVLALAWRRCR